MTAPDPAAETLRDLRRGHARSGEDEEKCRVLERFGGTFLSITALVVITAYQSRGRPAASHELRGDLHQARETNGELVKRPSANRRKPKRGQLQALQAVQTTVQSSSKIAALENRGRRGARPP